MCILIFSTTFVFKVSHSKKNPKAILSKMCIGLQVKYPLFLSDYNVTRIFSTDFLKTLISNFIKIRLVGAKFFTRGRTDGQT